MEERSDTYYLYKNISIPSKKQYKTQLKSKVEKAIKRIRWKKMEFLRKLNSHKNTETYGSINKIPSSSGRTIKFENDILLVIKNIKFRKINSNFQEKLSNGIKQIKNSDKVFLSANKSRQVYKIC